MVAGGGRAAHVLGVVRQGCAMRWLVTGLMLWAVPAMAAGDDPVRIGDVSTTFPRDRAERQDRGGPV